MELSDIGEDGLDDVGLADAADSVRGHRSEQQLLTAKKHFDQFLGIHNGTTTATDTAPHEFITAQVLGKFATYLFMKINKLKTAQSYISQMKTFFMKKWAQTPQWQLHPRNTTEQWYKDIRVGMRKMYTNRAIATGEDLVSQAPPMYRDSLRQVAACLFFDNSPSSLVERDLLTLQWHCMGRAGETAIRHDAIRFVGPPSGALQVVVGRSKTSTLQCLHAFCDADSWEADVFHALACHFATASAIDDKFHFQNTSASAINKILTRVCGQSEVITTRFQSHSGRRGCASEALSNSGVSVTEVISRGGWAFDAVSDMRVGRAVAGWTDSDNGAVPPSPDGLDNEARRRFDSFTIDLFRRALAYYDIALLTTLASSVVMYFNAVATAWSSQSGKRDCLIVACMVESMVRVGGKREDLITWSDKIREFWIVSNLPWLRLSTVDGIPEAVRSKVTVDMFSFRDVMERQLLSQQTQSMQLGKLQQRLEEQSIQIGQLNETVANLVRVNTSLVSFLQQQSTVKPARPLLLKAAGQSSSAGKHGSESNASQLPPSLTNYRASTIFAEFFANEWYGIVPTTKEKEILRKIKSCVLRVRDFLPATFNLTRAPARGSTSFASWYKDLLAHAALAEHSMIDFLVRAYPSAKKKTRSMLYVHAVNKEFAKATSSPDYPSRKCVDSTGVF